MSNYNFAALPGPGQNNSNPYTKNVNRPQKQTGENTGKKTKASSQDGLAKVNTPLFTPAPSARGFLDSLFDLSREVLIDVPSLLGNSFWETYSDIADNIEASNTNQGTNTGAASGSGGTTGKDNTNSSKQADNTGSKYFSQAEVEALFQNCLSQNKTQEKQAHEEYKDIANSLCKALSKDENNSKENIESIIDEAVVYLSKTIEAKDTNNDKKLTQEEWYTDITLEYLGIDPAKINDAETKAEMTKLFNNMDINGDGKLDDKELTAQFLFRDATNSLSLTTTEDKEDFNANNMNLAYDGCIQDENGKAVNLRFAGLDTGKSILDGIYDDVFGTQEKQAREEYKDIANSLCKALSKDENNSKENIESIIDEAVVYLSKTIEAKDTNNDKKLTQEEWYTDITLEYLGIDPAKINDAETKAEMTKLFNNMDINGDGKLDDKELTAQFLFRDATNSLSLTTTEDKEDFNANNMNLAYDGCIQDENGKAVNLRFAGLDTGKSILDGIYDDVFTIKENAA